jgi:hypothetical protein
MRYGDDRTVHRTEQVNIEVDDATGEVVSVWYRCMPLPFTVSRADTPRAFDMRNMYAREPMKGITAIIFTEEEKLRRRPWWARFFQRR